MVEGPPIKKTSAGSFTRLRAKDAAILTKVEGKNDGPRVNDPICATPPCPRTLRRDVPRRVFFSRQRTARTTSRRRRRVTLNNSARDCARQDPPKLPLLRGIDQRSAAPAGEPFPARLDKIRRAIVPADVSHPLRAWRCFSGLGRIFLDAGATRFFRFSARFFVSHIDPPLPGLILQPEFARPGQEAQGMEPCSSAQLIA